jgi:hypothetical protein
VYNLGGGGGIIFMECNCRKTAFASLLVPFYNCSIKERDGSYQASDIKCLICTK